MAFKYIQTELKDGVATLTLNRASRQCPQYRDDGGDQYLS